MTAYAITFFLMVGIFMVGCFALKLPVGVAMLLAAVIGLPSPLIAIHLLWVNLITDSLPAVALGADRKPKDIMNDQPRNPKESLFAHGGYGITFGYGILIGLVTLVAFLIKPIQALGPNGYEMSLAGLQAFLNSGSEVSKLVLSEAQSMAFCVLAFSELFHMLGMVDVRRSFVHVFGDKNLLLWVSFFLGLGLQIFVIEVPGVRDVFSVHQLSDHPIDYLWVFLLSISPLIIHEIAAFILFIKRKVKAK